MSVELYKTKTVPLIEAYDAGIARAAELITGKFCTVTPKGKCTVCAVGAIFLGVHPEVSLPTTPEEAARLDDETTEWVSSLRHSIPKSRVREFEEMGLSDLEDVLNEIVDFNDTDAELTTSVVTHYSSYYGDRDEWRPRMKARKDKVRRYIVKEGFDSLPLPVAKKIKVGA